MSKIELNHCVDVTKLIVSEFFGFFVFIGLLFILNVFLSLSKRGVNECGKTWGIDGVVFDSNYFCPEETDKVEE